MRILDQNDIELQEIDNSKGYLVEEEIIIGHHDAIEGKEEQGHYETIQRYPGGGEDVKWVVDVPGTAQREAYDETETILRFIPYTDREIAGLRITALKEKLSSTDYHILKLVEGAASLSDAAEVIMQRAKWRKEINELEEKL